MQSKNSRPLLLFYILVTYVLIQFVWWSYLLIKQNNEVYQLKSEINLLHHEDPQLVIEKGNELEKKLHGRWMMIAGEGMVFVLLIAFAFVRVRNTFNKEAELAAQQKNFLLSVTHELKSPIASVKLALETLLKRDLEKEKQKELLSNAAGDADRLNKLVENILLAARIDNSAFELHRENVNLSEYMEEGMKQTIRLFSPAQKIVFDIQPNILFNIDKTIFPSIILNLFENAVKYSPENSIIKIILKEEGNGVVLSVSDEGVGIPEDEKRKIFGKFYRVGSEEIRKTKGTGLGLYIVKYLVEKHNGTILVKDNSPRGSIFEVILNG
ncbi:MAG: two-component sensor histidine kinase [Bacteroidetes bacterium]|nr:MAG: two-component sensor histidine kinase [Bacteroidota bacterium]